MVTCTNPSCGKIFELPLKALNLQEESAKPYSACPFCLTKITDPELEIAEEKTSKQPQNEQLSNKEKSAKSKEKPTGCRYHLGYLSERQQGQQIPDDCIVCKNIVDCMLKKMKS